MAYVKREDGLMDISGNIPLEPRANSVDSARIDLRFGRNPNSALTSFNQGGRNYEPAFIETDFTAPLIRSEFDRHVASAPVPFHNSPRAVPPGKIAFASVVANLRGVNQRGSVEAYPSSQSHRGLSPVTDFSSSIRDVRTAQSFPASTSRKILVSEHLNRSLLATNEDLRRNPRQEMISSGLPSSRSRSTELLHQMAEETTKPRASEPRPDLRAEQMQVASYQSLHPAALQLMAKNTSNSGSYFQNIQSNRSPHTATSDGGCKTSVSVLRRPLTTPPNSVLKSTIKLEPCPGPSDSRRPVSSSVSSTAESEDAYLKLGGLSPKLDSLLPALNPATDGSESSASELTKAYPVALDCSRKPSQAPETSESRNDSVGDNGVEVKSEDVVVEPPKPESTENVGENGNDMLSGLSSGRGSCLSEVASESTSSSGEKNVDRDSRPDLNYADSACARTCMSALSLAAEGNCEEEREFVWDDYLEETNTSAAPPTSFKHVEFSLQNGFEKGMKLEVANRAPSDTFWVASILMTCGQLLRLRLEGCGDDGSSDFWCDILSSEVHQLGWCRENSRVLCPPEELKLKFPSANWENVLENSLQDAKTPSLYMLDRRTGPLPIDQIREGMFLEVSLELQPDLVWPVKIIENVGGRLLLRYEALETASDDFWLFYLHYRLHPIGWGKTENMQYHPPSVVLMKRTDLNWSDYLEQNEDTFRKNHPPSEIFEDQVKLQKHGFAEGWKLEALHPTTLSTFHPASVKTVINEYFFIVELLVVEDREPIQICCNSDVLNIFPVGWCSANGIKLCAADFDWDKYLSENSAQAAPKEVFATAPENELHGFEAGMKLEAVNICQPGQICVATITKVVDGVMWLHLDHDPTSVVDHVVPINTLDIFPIGWCESNNYPLKTPRIVSVRRHTNVPSERHLEDEARNALYMQMKEADLKRSSGWCPKIYFNCRCFTGRYLSKGRLVLLPKSVGPGSVVLVMTTVLSKLISVAYKSSRVLRELQLKGKPSPNMHSQLLRAKYKGKSYSAFVEICTSSDQISSFCRNVCQRLECCPNLISPHSYKTSLCPENCSRLTKGKYPYNFGQKKRKIGRPPGGHTNLDYAAKKSGKRRRHRKLLLTLRKKHGLVGRVNSGSGDDEEMESNSTGSWRCILENDESMDSQESMQRASRKRKKLSATTDIRTRGVKLPRYSFERKTHKKVLHSTLGTLERHSNDVPVPKSEDILTLASNPLYWTVQEVVEYIKTTDCANIARLFKEQEIDGQSLLLLSLPTVQEHLEPRLGPAVKLCHQIERLKVTFYQQFAA